MSQDHNQIKVKVNKDRRFIHFFGGFDMKNTTEIIQHLLAFSEDPYRSTEEVNLLLTSPGGRVDCYFSLYDVIQSIPFKTNVTALGYACSAGAMLLATTTRKRRAYPNTEIMIHEMSYGFYHDRHSQNKARMNFNERMHERLIRTLEKHTSLTTDFLQKNCQTDWWMYPEEAIQHGIIDEVIGSKTASL
jgi:ATP-dependent Clp protease, protease subunit